MNPAGQGKVEALELEGGDVWAGGEAGFGAMETAGGAEKVGVCPNGTWGPGVAGNCAIATPVDTNDSISRATATAMATGLLAEGLRVLRVLDIRDDPR